MAIDTFSVSGSPISASELNATLLFEHDALLREPADIIIAGEATLNRPRSGLGGVYNFKFSPATAEDYLPHWDISKYIEKMYAPITFEPLTSIAVVCLDGGVTIEQLIADMPKPSVSFPTRVDIQVNFTADLAALEDDMLLHDQLHTGEYGFKQTGEVHDVEPEVPRLSWHGMTADVEFENMYVTQAKSEDALMFDEFYEHEISDDEILDLI